MIKREVRPLLALTILVVLVMIQPVRADYEENIREGIYLVRPDNKYIVDTAVPLYLENEDLVFFACLELKDVPIRLSVLCLDNNDFADVAATKWGKYNCYIGSINLERFDCGQAVVQADYVSEGENLKLTQPIRINKFSNTLNRIIETQFSDGGWETSLDTAFGLLALSNYPEIFPQRIERALEFLKNTRNDIDKCWPKEQCRISTTANILFLLKKAGYEDLRIQHDGSLYLQRTQNYLSNVNWTVVITDHSLNINNTIDTGCVYEYDTALSTHVLSKYPDTLNLTFVPDYLNHVGVVCTENVFIDIYNEYDELLISYQGDNFSYEIPGACWTLNNEHIKCDLRATGFGINTDLPSGRISAASSYLGSLLVEDRTAGRHLTENVSLINDALLLHSRPSRKNDLIEFLLYKQKNNGSWSTNNTYYEHTYFEVSDDELAKLEAEVTDSVTQDIITTGYIVMALLRNNFDWDDEVILDAERWVSLVEDETGMNYTDEDLTDEDLAASYRNNRSLILNDTKRNAMAFYVLQNNARPILQAKPRVLRINQPSVEVDIVNPTIFELEDLEYEFSSDIDEDLVAEEKDYVGAYSFRRVTISRKNKKAVSDIGYLRLKKGGDVYLKLPIIIETAPFFNLSLPERMTVFGDTAILPFFITKSNHNFTCSLEWATGGISSTSAFNINKVNGTIFRYPVKFAVMETENKVYEGVATCKAADVMFKAPFAINIIRFSTKPIEVYPRAIIVNSTNNPVWMTVENLLDETIDVIVEVSQVDPYIILSDNYLSLYPGETRNITVEVIPPEGENYTSSNSIVFKTFNVEERVLIDMEIQPHREGGLPKWAWMIIYGLLIAGIGTGGTFAYLKRKQLREYYNKHFRKEDLREEVYKKVRAVEKEEELIAIRNMIKILKLQGISDLEVKKRLIAEGYSEENINEALQFTEKKPETKKSPAKKTAT